MKTKLEQWEDIQPMVQKEIQTQFAQLYHQYANKYGVASVPLHRHNGADSPAIGDASIINFRPLPATAGGVANEAVLDTQVINNPAQNSAGNQAANPPTVYVMPVPIVYGYGVGVHSAFNGGEASEGTVVFFDNGDTLSGLWVRTQFGWYRLAVDGNPPIP